MPVFALAMLSVGGGLAVQQMIGRCIKRVVLARKFVSGGFWRNLSESTMPRAAWLGFSFWHEELGASACALTFR